MRKGTLIEFPLNEITSRKKEPRFVGFVVGRYLINVFIIAITGDFFHYLSKIEFLNLPFSSRLLFSSLQCNACVGGIACNTTLSFSSLSSNAYLFFRIVAGCFSCEDFFMCLL